MKDHIRVKKNITLRGTPSEVINEIKRQTEGFVDVLIEGGAWNSIIGWRPMTEEELSKQKKRKARAAVATKKRREQRLIKERKDLEILAAKHNLKLVEATTGKGST